LVAPIYMRFCLYITIENLLKVFEVMIVITILNTSVYKFLPFCTLMYRIRQSDKIGSVKLLLLLELKFKLLMEII
jgi:hypothetical protein